MNTAASDWHILYEGHLSDAPGRSESWVESVRYLGRGAWQLSIDSTDFLGTESADETTERRSTRGMLDWVLSRDSEDAEHASLDSSCPPDVDDQDPDSDTTPDGLGPRAERLLEIADQVGAAYCARCLRGVADGSWPPAPSIKQVTGVTLRSVWRSKQPVFTVSTTAGPAYLYPPDADGTTRLVLTSAGNMDMGTTIALPKRWCIALDAWRHKLDSLVAAGSSSGSSTAG